jgi:UbiD family decarboxylase
VGSAQVDIKKLKTMNTIPEELRKMTGDMIFNHKAGYTIHRLVLCGENIDVYDAKDIMYVFSTRCRPNKDKTFFEECRGFPLIPFMSHGTGPPTKGEKVVSDALMPAEYQGEQDWQQADFKHSYPHSLQEGVNNRWTKVWGFSTEM